MAKNTKKKLQKSALNATKTAKKHPAISGTVVALGGFASSLLASQKFRDVVEEFLTAALSRASQALGGTKTEPGRALKALEEKAEASLTDLGEEDTELVQSNEAERVPEREADVAH